MSFQPFEGAEVGLATVRLSVVYDKIREETRAALSEFTSEIKAASQGLDAGLTGANRQLGEANRQVGLLSAGLRVAALGGVSALVATLGVSIKSAMDYETAFANVRKTVSGTAAELDGLNSKFVEMSKNTREGAAELANLGAVAGQMGIAAQGVGQFVDVVTKLGYATNISADQAAESLGHLAETLHLNQDEYSKFASSLVSLSNHLTATGEHILDTANRAGSAAELIGMTPQQLLAYSAALSSFGGQNQQATGTVLQRLFMGVNKFAGGGAQALQISKQLGVSLADLQKAANTGGAGFERMAASIGMSSSDLRDTLTTAGNADVLAKTAGTTAVAFKQMYDNDPSTAIQKFLSGLGQLNSYAQQDVLKKLGFDDIRVQQGVLNLANNIGVLNKALGASSDGWNQNNALTAAAAKTQDTLAFQLSRLQNTFVAQSIVIGKQLLPPLKDFVKWLTDNLPNAFKAMSDVWNSVLKRPVEELIDAFARLGKSIADIMGWTDALDGSGKAIDKAKGPAEGLATAFAMAANALKHIIDLLNTFVNAPFVAPLIQMATTFGAMALQLKIMLGLFGALRGAGRGLFNILGGGVFSVVGGAAQGLGGLAQRFGLGGSGGQVATPESTAMMEAAGAHTQAAAALTEAATAIKTAATGAPLEHFGNQGGGFSPTGKKVFDRLSAGGMAEADAISAMASMAGASGMFMPGMDYLPYRGSNGRFMKAGTGQYDINEQGFFNRPGWGPGGQWGQGQVLGALPANGMLTAEQQAANDAIMRQPGWAVSAQAEGGVKAAATRGLSAVTQGVSAGASIISKAFWPLFVADMVGNVVAGPVAGLIANATGNDRYNRAGDNGWIGLLGDVAHSLKPGSRPDYTARPDTYNVGGMNVSTTALEKGGVPGTLLDNIENGGVDSLLAQRQIESYTQSVVDQASLWQTSSAEIAATMAEGLGASADSVTAVRQAMADAVRTGDTAKIDASLADLRNNLQTHIAGAVTQTDTAVSDAINKASESLGVTTPKWALPRLEADTALTDRYMQSLDFIGTRGGAGANPLARWLQTQTFGGYGDAQAGGADALTNNISNLNQNLESLTTYMTNRKPGERAVGQFASQYGAQFEAANTAGPAAQRAALMSLPTNTLTPEELSAMKTDDGLQQVWASWWDAMLGAEDAGGFKGRAQLADQVKADLAAGFAGGLDLPTMKAKLGPLWDLLYDGLGDKAGDTGTRLAQAFWDAFNTQFSAATTPDLQAAAVAEASRKLNITVPGSNTNDQMTWLANYRIRGGLPDVVNATGGDQAQKMNDLLNSIPSQFRPTNPDDLIKRGVGAYQPEWAKDSAAQRQAITDSLNALRGDNAKTPWSAEDVGKMVAGSGALPQGLLDGAAGLGQASAAASTDIDTLGSATSDLRDNFGTLRDAAHDAAIALYNVSTGKDATGTYPLGTVLGPPTPAKPPGATGNPFADTATQMGYGAYVHPPLASPSAAAGQFDSVAAQMGYGAYLQQSGSQQVSQVASGVSGSSALYNAWRKQLGGLAFLLPASPVRGGPLKHPFLPEAGRKMVEQINQGIFSAPIGMPRFAAPKMTAQFAGGRAAVPSGAFRAPSHRGIAPPVHRMAGNASAGRGSAPVSVTRTQQIHVDNMTILSPGDESSVLSTFKFMAGE